MSTLPIVDASPLSSPDPADWTPVVEAIDAALREHGFMYIVGHGIAQARFDAVFDAARRFFAQPVEEKRKVSIETWNWHRGWGAIGLEKLEEGKPGDLKETFDMGRNLPADHPLTLTGRAVYGPNQYPDLPGFKDALEAYYADGFALALKLLRCIAIAFDEPVDYFDRIMGNSVAALRILHYLPASLKVHDDQEGAGAHTDYGCMTLLAQDDVGGLQVQAKDGSWIDAPPVEGAFVVNIGDMMGRWTNGLYRSTLHRVPGTLARERYSIPFFIEPDYDAVATVFDKAVREVGLTRYEPIVTGDWLMSRLNATFEHREGAAV